jgi:hypothetical protein
VPSIAHARRLNKLFLLQLGLSLLLRGFVHRPLSGRFVSGQHLVSRDLAERDYMVVVGTSAQDQVWMIARVDRPYESSRQSVGDLNSGY